MPSLADATDYAFAQAHFSNEALWAFFDGDRARLNIAHECIDRHAADPARIALRIAQAEGGETALRFAEIADLSGRFAHWLAAQGVAPGERVAVMLEPSRLFYACIFGAMKRGAVAVPLFTLFGPEAVRLRLADCAPRILVTSAEKAATAEGIAGLRVVLADAALEDALALLPKRFEPTTTADDMAIFQYTSGTTRELPEAVKHTHRALVVLMIAALYGTGIRPHDRFFCPSSPAWGHGLWHGTLAPLAMGVTTGVYAGRFDPLRLMQALQEQRVTNLSAAATHYRMLRTSGRAGDYRFEIEKLSFTGEPIDPETLRFCDATFGVPVCSMYGTTEVGVLLVNYPGARDFTVKPGALGKPVPGTRVVVQQPDGSEAAPDEVGEIKVWRRGAWFATKDLGRVDADGHFWHAGRADDVIISAGWTMSAVEIEAVLMGHPDVREAAAIAVPDALRGQVAKAFIVSDRAGDAGFARELQEHAKQRLSAHEYPRQVAFVAALPKTPAGKVNRRALREAEARDARTETA
jgi:acetyl-CoA synthetase